MSLLAVFVWLVFWGSGVCGPGSNQELNITFYHCHVINSFNLEQFSSLGFLFSFHGIDFVEVPRPVVLQNVPQFVFVCFLMVRFSLSILDSNTTWMVVCIKMVKFLLDIFPMLGQISRTGTWGSTLANINQELRASQSENMHCVSIMYLLHCILPYSGA